MAEETTEPTETAAPEIREGDGVAMVGGYPFNHRLRAEALAAAGKDRDEDELVSPELIADAAERVERLKVAEEEAAAAEAEANRLDGLKKTELEALALDEGVDLSSARNNADRAKLIEDARTARAAADATAGAPGTGDNNEPGDGESSTAGEGEGA